MLRGSGVIRRRVGFAMFYAVVGLAGTFWRRFPVFDPKNRIHWVAAIIIAVILILILGVASTASGQ